MPFQLYYIMLQQAIQLTHENVVGNLWSNDEAKAYLWVFGINKEAIMACLEHANNEKIFALAEQHKETMHQEYNTILWHKERNPSKYKQWKYPAIWSRGVDLEQLVDVPMHLLYLGITKNSVKRIMKWTKQTNKHNSFLPLQSGLLEPIAKLHVDWCVAIPLTGGNFGGWVSENYLALSQLLWWYFSILVEKGHNIEIPSGHVSLGQLRNLGSG